MPHPRSPLARTAPLVVLCLLAALASAGLATAAEPVAGSAPAPALRDGVLVRYLHTTGRCVTCKKIEEYAAAAVRDGFAAEIAAGQVVWESVNIDEPAFRDLVKRYQLFTKTVVVSRIEGGQEVSWKRLDEVWQLVRDREAFFRYVQAEVAAAAKAGAS
ncbi:MAG TPA: nitrophenyl compound nitroreductase subunit ArsF family protein [Thermoanaerobaculia bacterium]|nr:nitrophenyl compound nitroreductase subunit ArsF family protein [Thermoanaerobaculia bacterium]